LQAKQAPEDKKVPSGHEVHYPVESQVVHPLIHEPHEGVYLVISEQLKQLIEFVTQVEHLLSQA